MITPDEMSGVGLGTRNLQDDPSEYDQNADHVQRIRRLLEQGINTLDTSPVSDRGRSEVAIGNFLNQDHCREDVFLTSKCGYEWDLEDDLVRDLTLDRLHQELEESMNRMGINVLDLYLLNTVRDDFAYKESFDSLNHLKSDRNVRNIGLKSPSAEQLKDALEIMNLDFIQLPYSLFNREPFDTLEPICSENEVRIIVTNTTQKRGTKPGGNPEEASNGVTQTDEHFKKRLKFVIESFFEGEYPNEPIESLMASWAIGSPGVHSSVLELEMNQQLSTILRVLRVNLTAEDYRTLDSILSSNDY